MIPDTSDMTRVSDLTDAEEIALARKAMSYLTAFRWCGSVKESFLAFDIGYPLGVFLFRIEPRLIGVDDTLWVVVGDGPPAFLVCDDAPELPLGPGGSLIVMRRSRSCCRAKRIIATTSSICAAGLSFARTKGPRTSAW